MNNKSATIMALIGFVILTFSLAAPSATFAQVQTQIVGDTVYIKTDTQQRLSVWKDGTVNIAPNNYTTQPLFRVYPNGDITSGADNKYITDQFKNKNGLRFNRKLGILEVGVSNNIDTAIDVSNDHFQPSGLVVNSDSSNVFTGKMISSIVAGDYIRVLSPGSLAWSIVTGEQHVILGPLHKSNMFGYGHVVNAPTASGVVGSAIMGISNRIDSINNSTVITGLGNRDSGYTIASFISGRGNRFGGHAQFVAGAGLVAIGYGSTTLGLGNVDFASLPRLRNPPVTPSNLKDYPALAIGNSGNWQINRRSNALTVLFNGRTQINTTGYDSTLTEAQVTPRAALEIVSTNSGVLLPKLTTTQRNAIASGDKHSGLLLYNTDSSNFQFYDGSAWRSITDNGVSGINTSLQSLTDVSGTIAWNVANGISSAVTLNNDAALVISNPVAGQTYKIRIKQGTGAPRFITEWPDSTLWPDGNGPTLSTTTNGQDVVKLFYDGTYFFGNYELRYKPIYDPDAAKYFDSVATTGSLSVTEKNAWNTFVRAAKSGTNYWNNIAVINPVLGATSAEHAWNAKNPATFKATYSGTITHTANHMVSNGTTGYVNSHFNMNTDDGDGLATIAVWVRNNVDAVAVAMGAISATNRYTQIYPRFGNTFYGQVNTNNAISEAVTVSTSVGLSLATRLTSTGIYIQRDGTQTGGTSSSLVTNNDIYVLAQNSNGSAANFSTYQVCMYMIATTPFTTAQAAQFYTDFSTFIAAVGR